MTEQDQTETETVDTPAEANEDAAAQTEDELGGDASDSDDDAGDSEPDDDDSGDEDKPDKPKKVKISYEASMPRNEAVSYFEAIVGGLRSGRLEFKQDGETLVLSPPDQLEVEVKAQRKGDKGKVVFEIEWSNENRPLEILN
ncbi:hypothetical protein ENSA5_17090 [Enhygromyxa salina]|uniref:Amphi-Trp domain-containing protein n=1 Tax=Enhygromyxa salina TaxID=215803 RepID=A0A2S9YDY5_9BACT|nr:amphi-Trp domain-containing protein [Enhygromyxa salina]PRQ03319.1 hypothetical protein ENSA5_17090 [Enhygromyxa salina]